MTNALHEAADIVDNAWCKEDLKREAASKEARDAYCAVGALAAALGEPLGLVLDPTGENVGTPESVQAWATYWDSYDDDAGVFTTEQPKDDHTLQGTYAFVRSTKEARVLCSVIFEKFSHRVNLSQEVVDQRPEFIDEVIYGFNDHDDTTREDVIHVMTLAAERLDK